MTADAITADSMRDYQLSRRKQGMEAATINRETSALCRMFQLAILRGLLERMPLFPKRLEENPPRDGFFEHDEYLKVRMHLPPSFQDVLDFAYYSGWRRNEILGLTWDEVDEGVTPQDFTIRNFAERIEAVGDLWAALRKAKGADLKSVTTKITKNSKNTKNL